MAAGSVDTWLHNIRTATSKNLDLLLLKLPVTERAGVVNAFTDIKDWRCEVLSAKFAMWKHLPYVLLGLAHADHDKAQLCARIAISEWDVATDKNKVHRVAHRFLADPLLGAQLREFSSSENGLQSFPAYTI